jgi:CelD/BcsL family acetyltransferase involved in cellulose biosynthesis
MIEASLNPSTQISPPRAGRSVFPSEPRNRTAAEGGTLNLALTTVVINSAEELNQHIDAWDDLARDAIEPNAFYEPWMLIPAAESFSSGRDLRFILIYGSDPARLRQKPIMCGMFPLERVTNYRGLPVTALRFWKHDYCFLCTPLVRSGVARQCLAAFLDWLRESRAHLMEFNFIGGDGRLSQVLIEAFNVRGSLTFQSETFTRAVLRPGLDGHQYVKETLPGRRIKDLRRCERQLAECGRIEYAALDPVGDVHQWLEDFALLESRGWKGREGTAMAARAADLEFFRHAAVAAFERGRLMMLALRFEGRPIAMKCNFLAGDGSFAFKIAFDESFARFSPGVLLEIENIHRAHADQRIEWMDSCASPAHAMINRLWKDRRVVQTTLVSTGTGIGRVAVSAIPLLRWANRAIRPRAVKKTPEVNK